MMEVDQPVDAVIMWVDGSSEAFRQSEQDTLKGERKRGKKVVHSAARHRDNGELRYLVRGIEQHMPWIRHIYIVTNGQKPGYINFDQPGISQVSHGDIFDRDEQLPCFNTFAIDSYTHRIEGLSEYFIRFSDDFFVGRSLTKESFLNTYSAFIFSGAVQESPTNRYQAQVKHNADVMEKVLGVRPKFNCAHVPQLRSRSRCERFVEAFSHAIAKTRDNKFRTRKDVIPLLLYPYYALFEASPSSIDEMRAGVDQPMLHVPKHAVSGRHAQVAVGQEGSQWKRKLKKVLETRPAFFNLNDSFGPDSLEDGVAVMDAFLQQMFPEPSRFEVPAKARPESDA